MKKIIITVLFLMPATLLMAQPNYELDEPLQQTSKERPVKKVSNNFIRDDGRLFWQHIFETTLATEDIYRYFTSEEWAVPMRIEWSIKEDLTISGTFRDKLNYKPYEINAFSTPMYIMEPCEYSIRIDIKESRYRVTIFGVRFNGATISNITNQKLAGSITSIQEDWYEIEKYTFDGDYYKRQFVKIVGPMLDNMWLTEYTIADKDNRILGDEW